MRVVGGRLCIFVPPILARRLEIRHLGTRIRLPAERLIKSERPHRRSIDPVRRLPDT